MASILETPHLDPVPPYAPHTGDAPRQRDSDAVSVISLAPSYHSTATELPSYDSIRPLGLPRVHYAPGFTPATQDPFSPSNFTNSSSVQRTNPARRQYENVANRRVEHGEMMANFLATLANIPGPLSLEALPSVAVELTAQESAEQGNETMREEVVTLERSVLLPQGAGAQTASNNRNMLLGYCPYIAPPTLFSPLPTSPPVSSCAMNNAPKSLPANPHEDPELVGHEAAERAKAQRLYRETLRREMAAQAIQQKREEDSLLEDNLMGLFSLPGHKQRREWNQFKDNFTRARPGQTPFRRWSRS